MLVLTRKKGEGITLILPTGEKIHLVTLGAGSVRIGICAPSSIKILRDELIDDRHSVH